MGSDVETIGGGGTPSRSVAGGSKRPMVLALAQLLSGVGVGLGALGLGCGRAPAGASARETGSTPAPVAAPGEPATSAPRPAGSAPPAAPGPCPDGMALVEADYCPHLVHNCLEQLKEGVGCCKVFAERNWCFGKPERRRFCIDRFEYPNLEGVKPAVMVSWDEARGACETEGKRLCLESEWNLACEGGERLPYPYGRVRDSEACNIDRPRPKPEPRSKSDVFVNPRKVGAEVARLDQRVESGARPRCASPFGVHDMTGNVDEWVVNEAHFGPTYEVGKAPPVVSGLKGGYWGPIRARCRPMTTGHDRPFRYYQTGFRCCANAPEGPDGVADAFFEKMTRWRRAAQ